MREEILTLARAVSGAKEAEDALLESLCEAARLRWEARLRPGLAPEDCGTAFACAAAFAAAADLAAGRGGGAVGAFTAGEISVKGRGAAEAAALAREYIFSDKGQTNLAIAGAIPTRTDFVVPAEIQEKTIPQEPVS